MKNINKKENIVSGTGELDRNIEKKRYTVGEEIFNSVSHGVGALLSIAALVLAIIAAVLWQGTSIAVISAIIYGMALIVLYMSSTLYHALTNVTAKKVFRIFDHSSIFILIAGTYTPIMLVSLADINWGVIMCLVLWGLTALGVVLNSLSIERFKVVSMILYVGMGWAAVFAGKFLLDRIALPGLVMILIGGLAYTGGLFFYGMKKFKYMHSVWHLFVLAGSVVHFIAILLFIYRK